MKNPAWRSCADGPNKDLSGGYRHGSGHPTGGKTKNRLWNEKYGERACHDKEQAVAAIEVGIAKAKNFMRKV